MTAFAFAGMTVMFLSSTSIAADQAMLDAGRVGYNAYCARCHGPEGKGDGPDAKRVTVTPRDLTSGKFKFRTTMSGTPPSDEDLKNSLRRGLPGSGMPSFANLETNTLESIVQYVKTLSGIFDNPNNPPQPIKRPPNEKGRVDLKKGEEVYGKLQCALCHGPGGRADGTSAFTLVDGWNEPIKVANLSEGWTFRGGHKPIDIYHRIMAGIEGAPMPSYDGAVTPEDAWHLSNYVASLQLDAHWKFQIIAGKIESGLPASADDKAWDKAARTDVNLQAYHYEKGKKAKTSINAVSVQVLSDGKNLCFRLEWNDPVEDGKTPPDAFLVALKPDDFKGDPRANLHTLYAADAEPLDLTYWQAGRPTKAYQRETNLFNGLKEGFEGGKSMPATAVYKGGVWTLVFSKPLSEAELKRSALPLGFAAWDGHNGDTGLQHVASQWIQLVWGPTQPH